MSDIKKCTKGECMNWEEIGKLALAVITAVAAVRIAFKLIINRKSNNQRTVVKDNRVGGDIVVGSKTTKSNIKR
jgi:hypothetical protein